MRGSTTSGPHRDDLCIELDDHDIQGWASQGQNRLVVITLKIALLRLVSELRQCEPLLLLDDVSSELDTERSEWLSEHLRRQGGQVLATTTDAKAVGLSSGAISQFRVWSGTVRRPNGDGAI
jgi:DNA replication and repair protein RecF